METRLPQEQRIMGDLEKARIYRCEKELTPITGNVVKWKEMTVAGENLEECKKVFEEMWNNQTKSEQEVKKQWEK